MQNFQGFGQVQVPPKGLLIHGTDQNESFDATPYADEIHAGGGNDTVWGNDGDDLLYGDAGKDVLIGGVGNDTLDGGIDNDILMGGAGADRLIGGDGFDTASYADATLGVTIDFRTGGTQTNDAYGDTFSSIEKFIGSSYSDVFIASGGLPANFDGGAGDDWLFGAKGADTLNGGSGDDHLDGGYSADFLNGGTGLDTMTGGSGADTFYIARNSGADTITDFVSGGDKLMLAGFGSNPLDSHGQVVSLNFGHAVGAGDAVYSTDASYNAGTLWYDLYDHTLYAVETTTQATNTGSFHSASTVTSAVAVATFSDDTWLSQDSYGHHMLTAQDLVFV